MNPDTWGVVSAFLAVFAFLAGEMAAGWALLAIANTWAAAGWLGRR